jgi:hypothetical protein
MGLHGQSPRFTRDGPFAEAKELVAGFWIRGGVRMGQPLGGRRK